MGKRKDGELIKRIDSMHVIMPLIFPNRCDNEAYIKEVIDITNINFMTPNIFYDISAIVFFTKFNNRKSI